MNVPLNIAARPLTAHTAGAVLRPAHLPVRANVAGKIIAAEKQVLDSKKQKPTFEDRTIGVLNKARETIMGLVMFGWINVGPVPLPVPAILAGVLAKFGFKSAKSFADIGLKAPIEALQTTKATEWYKAPGAMLDNAAKIARESEGKMARDMAGSIEKLAGQATLAGDKVGVRVTSAMKPMHDGMQSGIDKLGRSAVGQQAEKGLGKFAQWRAGVNEVKSTKAMGKAADAFTKESTGIFGRIKNFITRSKPAAIGTAKELQGAQELLKAGKLEDAAAAVTKAVGKEGASKQVLSQGNAVLNQLNKASMATGKVDAAKELLNKGFGGLMKSSGKTKLYTAVIAAGVTAGVAATVMLTNKQNRLAKQALDDLATDLGDKNHPLVQQASKLNKGQTFKNWTNTGLTATGEAVWLGTMNAGMSAVPALMAIQGGLPMAAGLFFKDNALLDSYTALKEAEKGKLEATQQQKTEWFSQLVAVTPLAKQFGGQQSIGAQHMGAHMVEKGMSVRDALHTLNDPVKLEALAKEVVEKRHAAAAAKGETVTPANDGPAAQVKAEPFKAAAPAGKIELASVANEGRLVSQQKALG